MAVEGVWRDYYTGEELDNYTKPWITESGDSGEGTTTHCINYFHGNPKGKSWQEWVCRQHDSGCPCGYEESPILHLRGYCSATYLEQPGIYTPYQLQTTTTDVILVGRKVSKIWYRSDLNQWHTSKKLVSKEWDFSQKKVLVENAITNK